MPSAVEPCGLEDIFAHCLAESHEFRSWLLSRTKFARLWPLARLVATERADGGLTCSFRLDQTDLNFGLYIVCASDAAHLRPCMKGKSTAHMDFETVLLAPQALILNDDRSPSFGRRIPFETVAGFVPEFGQRQRIAA